MGILAFGSVILDAQSQGAGRHQWDVNAINAVKIARVGSPILKTGMYNSRTYTNISI